MRRTAGEIQHNAAATSWADITTQGAGATGRGREGEQRRVHTVREERESEREGDRKKSRHPGGQGWRHIPGQEETGRSDTMVAVTPDLGNDASSRDPDGMRVGQEKETHEIIYRATITQHVQHEGNQSDVEEEGSGKESVLAEVCCEADTSAPIDAEDFPDAQTTRPKRPKNYSWTGQDRHHLTGVEVECGAC